MPSKSRVSPKLIKDFDKLAASLGETPKLDDEGEIIPIGAQCPKQKTYVVWVGRAIGLFNNWGLTSAMVSAYPGAIHKSFRSLEQARAAWYEGPTKFPNWAPPAPRRALATPGIAQADNPAEELELEDPSDDEDTPIKAVPTLTSAPPIPVRLPSHVVDDPFGTPTRSRAHSRASSVSSVSSVSATSMSSFESLRLGSARSRPSILTEGTLSDYDASSPVLSDVDLPPIAPSTPRRRPRAAALPVAITPPTSPQASRAARRTPAKQRELHEDSPGLTYDRVRVRRGKYVFVVVRGDHPGVYFERVTALLNAGFNPGMKVVAHKSLSGACWYFVQKFMQKEVGVPAIEVSDSEEDA